ncbi:MAG TPA: hypothetical protein VGM39_14605 [Kofleriaceae bacterium]|jgi:hypothetical protein
MSRLARRAELAKLAHLFGRDIQLELDATELRTLRTAVSARLFDDSRPVLQRVATGSRLLPTALVAKVGEAVFGATLCAQIAGLLSTNYALDLALRMSDPFLAKVSAAIDPRSAGEVVKRIPADRIVAVGQQMLERGDYVSLARFVDYLSEETLTAVIASIPDEIDLLRIGAYVESSTKLRELVGGLAIDRTRRMLAAVPSAGPERRLELLTITEQLDPEQRERLAGIATEIGDAELAAAIRG